MKPKKRYTCAVLCFVLFVCCLSACDMSKPSYVDATIEEKEQIELFYTFVPEMISEGELFDVKFIVSTMNYTGNCYFKGKTENLLISFVRKNVTEDNFLLITQYYSNSKFLYGVQYPFVYDENIFEESGEYLVSSHEIAFYDCIGRRFIDEIIVTFQYDDIEETHNLKYNQEYTDELMRNMLEVRHNYTGVNENDFDMHVENMYIPYMASILHNDFAKWEGLMTESLNSYQSDHDSLGAASIKYYGTKLVSSEDIEEWLSGEELERYENVVSKYRNVFEN